MNPDLALDVLLLWSAQVCVLVAAAALGAMTLTYPKARLLFWQGLLLLLICLPLLEPWRQSLPVGISSTQMDALQLRGAPTMFAPESGLWRREYWLALIGAGCALRLLWVGIGFLRLRRYRQEAQLLPAPPTPFGALGARWYVHDDVSGPVTYGWRRPLVLLPARFPELPSAEQEAIACHELVHIHRRDWLFVIAEELIRSAFWFHPAIWFALSRIQLAREQAVDREAVLLTQNRDGYLDALMAIAAQNIRPDVAPAPLFLKRRHLAARVAAVLQEVSVSKPRLYVSFATVCSALLLAGRLSIWLFPFASPAQVQPDDEGITVEAGAKLLHRTPLHYPPGYPVSGTVTLEATINNKGEVADARILNGPAELRKTALASVLDWHYEANSGRSTVPINITFGERPADVAAPAKTGSSVGGKKEATPGAQFGTVNQIMFVGLATEQQRELRSRLPLHVGEAVTVSDVARIVKLVKEFDIHLNVNATQRRVSENNLEANFVIGLLPERAASRPVSPAENFPPAEPGVQRLRVDGAVQASNLASQAHPVYPSLAKQARVSGVVQFATLINRDGKVQAVQLIGGHPLLVPAAEEAVKQWVYRPTLLNGAPVEVVSQVDVNFTLAE